jgi:hypothetical protein
MSDAETSAFMELSRIVVDAGLDGGDDLHVDLRPEEWRRVDAQRITTNVPKRKRFRLRPWLMNPRLIFGAWIYWGLVFTDGPWIFWFLVFSVSGYALFRNRKDPRWVDADFIGKLTGCYVESGYTRGRSTRNHPTARPAPRGHR